MKKTIPLNIVFTYPVHWKTFEILRDFVQNFYDSVPCSEWYRRFQYEYRNDSLSMWVDNQSFSYEWLLHIGASTKTNSSKSHAGYFGEGFKIASLCAYRDKKWKIRMSSSNWSLDVVNVDKKIDNQSVKMLAYDVSIGKKTEKTKLLLEGVSENDFKLFKNVLKSFYFPENILLGKPIWAGKNEAVYTRSSSEYAEDLPYNDCYGRKGIVFCGYQVRGSIPFNLVVCDHTFSQSDRERKTLFRMDVVDVLKKVANRLPPKAAAEVLEKMRRHWLSYMKGEYDFYSWYPVIRNLVQRMTLSHMVVEDFRNKYPNLLTISKTKTIQERNTRAQAKTWLDSSPQRYVLVNDCFLLLGYHSLEQECESMGGLVNDDYVHKELQHKCFEILEDMCKKVYEKFFIMEKFPQRRIIVNPRASYHGMAQIQKRYTSARNNEGLPIRNMVQCIFLKECIFKREHFYDAVSTYVHELCHMFGGDCSENFSRGLTKSMEILLSEIAVVENAHAKWMDLFK